MDSYFDETLKVSIERLAQHSETATGTSTIINLSNAVLALIAHAEAQAARIALLEAANAGEFP